MICNCQRCGHALEFAKREMGHLMDCPRCGNRVILADSSTVFIGQVGETRILRDKTGRFWFAGGGASDVKAARDWVETARREGKLIPNMAENSRTADNPPPASA